MEEPFLPRDEQLLSCKATWQSGQVTAELKKVSRLAVPMATVTVAQYLLPVISVMVAGHIGELQLAGVALATSFTNVSGFSIMVIMLLLSPLQFKNQINCPILELLHLFLRSLGQWVHWKLFVAKLLEPSNTKKSEPIHTLQWLPRYQFVSSYPFSGFTSKSS